MADEANQSGQSSSAQGGQSAQGQQQGGAQGAESTKQQQSNQNQNNGGQQQQQQAPQRPAYVPEVAWDAVSGKVKEDVFEKHVGDLSAFKAAEDSRRLTIPKPEAYALELPKEFAAPAGVSFEFNKDDPILAQFRTLANKRGLDQEGFSEGLGMIAAMKIGEQQQFDTAKAAEISKLGVNATARVTALQTWLTAMGGKEAGALIAVMDYAPKADTIIALENLMKKVSSQGNANFTQSGRDHSEPEMTDEKWNSMSFGQKRDYTKGKAA